MKPFITLLCCCLSLSIFAQHKITGELKDDKGEAIPFANVILNNNADSSLAKAAYSNDDGSFELINLKNGDYFLVVSAVGYAPYRSDILSVSNDNLSLETITVNDITAELSEVTVTAKKALIEVKPDRTVFNVSTSSSAVGNNGLELLRKAPGVVIDNDENIILQGKNGVQIYIDGKPSPLSMEDLKALLKGMQSSDIEAIEIITNPSAKFDAEGNAGIINIRMKRDKNLGMNMNFNIGATYGIYPKYNGSASFNYRNKAVNIFGSLGSNFGSWENFHRFHRWFGDEGEVDVRSLSINKNENYNARLGADFNIGKFSTIGVLFNGNLGLNEGNNISENLIYNETTGDLANILRSNTSTEGERTNTNYNLNYRYANKKGIVWNADVDFGKFTNRKSSNQPNAYYDAEGVNITEEFNYFFNTPTDVDIYTAKIDHERPMFGGKFETGLKTAYVITDNTFEYFDVENGVKTLNLDRTNDFEYTENVNAAYLSFQKQFGKVGLQLGLRGEHTYSLGDLKSETQANQLTERDYFNLFPSGGLTYAFNQKNMGRLTYSRRIDRPNYENLNPFEDKLDELNYRKGNPFLKPQYSHNLELGYTYNYSLNVSLAYTHTEDMFAQVISQSDQNSNASLIRQENIASQDITSLTISLPFPITKWWSTYTNINAYHSYYQAELENNEEIDLAVTTLSLYSQQTFSLSKSSSFEISGFYNSPSVWGGTIETDAMWGMDVGFSQKLWGGKGNLKIAFSDIFLTQYWTATSDYNDIYMEGSGRWESQSLRINFSYLLGNDQMRGARRRKTGLEDESKRIGN